MSGKGYGSSDMSGGAFFVVSVFIVLAFLTLYGWLFS